MSKLVTTAKMLLIGLCGLAATGSYASILSPTRDAMTPFLSESMSERLIPVQANRGHANRGGHNVNRSVNVNRNVYVSRQGHHHVGGVRGVAVVRPWVVRPYYGTVIAGVALGTFIAATTVAVVPVAPAPNLCWYWADPAMIQGYWDYCKPPY